MEERAELNAESHKHPIVLPAGCTALHTWKVKSGSAVRKGETVALALPAAVSKGSSTGEKEDAQETASPASETTPGSSDSTVDKPSSTTVGEESRGKTLCSLMRSGGIGNDAATAVTGGKTTGQESTPAVRNCSSNAALKAPSSRASIRERMKKRARMTAASSTATESTTPANVAKVLSPADGFLRIADNPLSPILGHIEPCTHPAMIDGMCAVCGRSGRELSSKSSEKVDNGSSSDAVRPTRGGLLQSLVEKVEPAGTDLSTEELSRVTVSGGVTIEVSAPEAQSIASQSRKRLTQAKKLSLVLDLDHTLVHATADQRAAEDSMNREDVRIALLRVSPPGTGPPQGIVLRHFIKLRPHLKEFLLGIMERYEVSVYTAGTRAYALQVADVICRYIVGAYADEEELNHLRSYLDYTVKRAAKVKVLRDANAALSTSRDEATEQENEGHGLSMNTGDEDNPIQTKTGAEVANDDTTSVDKKRRRGGSNDLQPSSKKVCFGELPANGSEFDSETAAGKNNEAGNSTPTEEISTTKRASFHEAETSHASQKPPCSDGESKEENAKDSEKIPETKKDMEEKEEEEDIEALVEDLKVKLKEAEKLEAEAKELCKKLFGSRIVSRTDVGDLGKDVKSLRRVFPCGGMMTAIVDDREDVWARASDNSSDRRPGEPPMNLLLLRPYHWKRFLGYADVNNASGDDPTESLSDESKTGADGSTKAAEEDNDKEDNQLLWTADILKRLHERYYSLLPTDDKVTVPSVLETMRREVLNGSTLVFSGLVPLHHQARGTADASKPRPAVVRYAEDLGATVVSDVGTDVTHIVAARPGTDKVTKGSYVRGCAVVKISWLMQCYWGVTRRDVGMHLWSPIRLEATLLTAFEQNKQQGEAPPGESKRTGRILLSDSSDSSEEDDDSFAAGLEQDMLES